MLKSILMLKSLLKNISRRNLKKINSYELASRKSFLSKDSFHSKKNSCFEIPNQHDKLPDKIDDDLVL